MVIGECSTWHWKKSSANKTEKKGKSSLSGAYAAIKVNSKAKYNVVNYDDNTTTIPARPRRLTSPVREAFTGAGRRGVKRSDEREIAEWKE
jgi:hypothetical protein